MLTFRMARIQSKLNAQGARILRQSSGLSLAQWRILVILSAYGDISPAEVSRTAQFDKGLLSRKVKLLIEDGLVRSAPHPHDRRQQILSLTEKGRALFEKTQPYMHARQSLLHDSLNEQEMAAFLRALDKLEAAVTEVSEAAE